jgi:lycopene cyclase domain-containing protein
VTYTQLALLGAAIAVLTDTAILGTWLLRRRIFWTAYAIVLSFQLVTNGVLTGRHIVRYDPATILGPRIAYAPVEDILFGFALVTLTLSGWVRLGRHRARDGFGGGWRGRGSGRGRRSPGGGRG